MAEELNTSLEKIENSGSISPDLQNRISKDLVPEEDIDMPSMKFKKRFDTQKLQEMHQSRMTIRDQIRASLRNHKKGKTFRFDTSRSQSPLH